MADIHTTAREYLRVSKDKTGRRRSVDEQHVANVDLAVVERDWTLGEPYVDNDRSASKFATKAREDFGKLISDLETGQFGAHYLILWEGSRGSREIEEWVRLIKLCERAGVEFYITSEDRILDPRNDHDWAALISMGQASEIESRKTSKRARRATAAQAAAGRPHGICPDGYSREYDPKTGQLVAQVIDPDRAMIPRTLFDLLLAGEALKEIARRFEAHGWFNKSGGRFSEQHLRSMAISHAYTGLRVHKKGRKAGERNFTPDQLVEATWEPIVDRETFWKVQAILAAPERKTTRGGRAAYLVSMIGQCWKCEAPIVSAKGRTPNSPPVYACRYGHVRVNRDELDDHVTAVVLAYLSRPDVYELLTPDEPPEELAEVRGRIAQVEYDLDQLGATLARREISVTLAAKAETEWTAELEALRGRVRELETPAVLQGLLRPGADVRARWGAASIATRRAVVRALCTPGLLGEVVVQPAAFLRQPVRDRVEWRRSC